MVVVSSLCISLEKQSACERAGGDTFNPVYRANSKSLSEELRRLTSCSYPPNMYIALARTQAEWPSLAPGTVPEILGMNHLWVSVKMQHSTLSTVVMDASSHLTATVPYSGEKKFLDTSRICDVPVLYWVKNQSRVSKCSFNECSHKHLPTSCVCTVLGCFPCTQI